MGYLHVQYLRNLAILTTVSEALRMCQHHSTSPLSWKMQRPGRYVARGELYEYRVARLSGVPEIRTSDEPVLEQAEA